jgi:hypothetical protein
MQRNLVSDLWFISGLATLMLFRATAFNSFLSLGNETRPLVSRASFIVAHLLGDRDHDCVLDALGLGRPSCWNLRRAVLACGRFEVHKQHGTYRHLSG